MLTLGFVKVTRGYVKKAAAETLPFFIERGMGDTSPPTPLLPHFHPTTSGWDINKP
jgi:hypothetical protein